MIIDLIVSASCYAAGGSAGPQPGNCSASADFSNTGTVDGIAILDSKHQIVNGATFTSASGYTYPTLTSVPEPRTLSFLLITSLLAAAIGLPRSIPGISIPRRRKPDADLLMWKPEWKHSGVHD